MLTFGSIDIGPGISVFTTVLLSSLLAFPAKTLLDWARLEDLFVLVSLATELVCESELAAECNFFLFDEVSSSLCSSHSGNSSSQYFTVLLLLLSLLPDDSVLLSLILSILSASLKLCLDLRLLTVSTLVSVLPQSSSTETVDRCLSADFLICFVGFLVFPEPFARVVGCVWHSILSALLISASDCSEAVSTLAS